MFNTRSALLERLRSVDGFSLDQFDTHSIVKNSAIPKLNFVFEKVFIVCYSSERKVMVKTSSFLHIQELDMHKK